MQEAMAAADVVGSVKNIVEEKSISSKMLDLLETARHADVELVVGTEPEVQVYKAHKLILSANSSVFHDMFYGPSRFNENQVHIADIDPAAFQDLLKYIYTGSCQLCNMEDVCLILYAAKKYIITALIVVCRVFISENLSVENVPYVYGFLKQFDGEETLTEKCVEITKKETTGILKSKGFLRSKQAFIECLVSEEHLKIPSEATLLTAVMAWGMAEIQRKGLPVTKENKRAVLKFAIPKIRFLSLTAEEFTGMLDIIDMFSPTEYYSLLSNIIHPLPENICTIRKQRDKP